MTAILSNPADATARATPRSPSGNGWLHLCNGLDPVRDGGMVPSILGMTGALTRSAVERVSILTPTPSRLGDTVTPAGLSIQGPESDLEDSVRRAAVVHMHGLWQAHTRRGGRAARRARVPYLIAAHGMAEPWAMRHKALKKRIYTALVEGKNLRHASCLHALTRPEIGHLRALAPRTPVCFVPNGVDLAPFENLPSRSVLEAEFPELSGKFVLLFYGRLHAKKGLDLLAEALGRLASDHPELHVVLAGTNDGALAPFKERCEARGVTDRVTWVGHVSGERARTVWARADAFALPSYSEGFSMAILEALACRLPVLFTTACHFPELAAARGGVMVQPIAEDVESGLRKILEMSMVEQADLGRRGRELVERNYTWDQQAERLASVYRWLERGGNAPDAVVAETL